MSESDAKGPSKKELNKLARKEKATSGSAIPQDNSPAVFTVSFCRDNSQNPDLTRTVELYSNGATGKVRYSPLDAKKSLPVLSSLANPAAGKVAGDSNIARFLVRSTPSIASLYGNGDALASSQVDQWLDVYTFALVSGGYLASLPALLENVLSSKTFLVGHSLTLADIAIFIALKKGQFTSSTTNVSRWSGLIASLLPEVPAAIPIAFAPSNPKGQPKKDTKEGSAQEKTVVAANSVAEEGGSCPPLEGAEDGKVCTRFPPEPSGYLHIGHAKAVLLNQYYAQRYNGRLLVRFDDTNPSKEKEEYADNILQDLKTLGINPDAVSLHQLLFFCSQRIRWRR